MLNGHSRDYLYFLVDVIDVEKGLESQMFRDDQVVGVIKFHPDNSNLFLSGGSKGKLRLWDCRNLSRRSMNTFEVWIQFLMLNSPPMGSNSYLPVMFMGVTLVKILLSFGTFLDRFHCLIRYVTISTNCIGP